MTKPVTGSRRALAGAAGIIIGLGAVDSAQAQLEDIVVSARRVEENVLEVPIAVSPFSQETIQKLNLRDTDDIALFTPGFSFTPAFGRQPGSDRPTIRGISTILNGIGNASAVAYFVDGVYLGGSPQSTELANLERVEILRGPQAAQFGRGTYVGAINYVTRKPTEDFEAIVDVSGGSDNLFIGTASLSGPITDSLAYFVSAGFDTIDGQYQNNAVENDNIGGEKTSSVTAKLLWEPTENFDATLRVGFQETDDQHFAAVLQGRELNNVSPRTAEAPRARGYYQGEAVYDPNDIALNTDILTAGAGFAGTQLERQIFSLSLNWGITDNIQLSSITGYIDDQVETAFDQSYAAYTPLPFSPGLAGLFNQWDLDEQTDFSQELRAQFTGLDNWRFVIGGYYYKGTADEIFSTGIGGPPFAGAITELTATNTIEKIENVAVFGSVDWQVLDNLAVTVEARWAEDKLSVREVPQSGGGAVTQSNEGTFDNVTPRFTAVWSITDDLNIYGNIAKGTKPGAFNNSAQCPDLPVEVDEESAWNYELGMKGSVWDNRATFALAGYLLEVEDQQLTTVCEDVSTGLTTSGITNAGKTEVIGLEFEGTFALTDFWTAGLTYAYTDGEIKERISIDQADLNGSLGGIDETIAKGNVAGQKVFRSPEHMFSLFTRLDGELGGENSWWVSVDYAFEGSKFSQEHNLIETGARNLLGGSIGLNLGPWQLSIWGKNLLDDDTPIDILRYIDRRGGGLPACDSFGTAIDCSGASTSERGFALTLPRQRTIGARAIYRFGGSR